MSKYAFKLCTDVSIDRYNAMMKDRSPVVSFNSLCASSVCTPKTIIFYVEASNYIDAIKIIQLNYNRLRNTFYTNIDARYINFEHDEYAVKVTANNIHVIVYSSIKNKTTADMITVYRLPPELCDSMKQEMSELIWSSRFIQLDT